jgi:ribonucleoside-diphosphate reductase alpha chain
MATDTPLSDDPISRSIWDMKYRFKQQDGTPVDQTIEDTWRRVASALAQAENKPQRKAWAARFYEALADYRFLPAGRILSGAGTQRQVTLFNCFVMGTIPDDMAGIFESLKQAALTLQQGGGIGYDFSTLRPQGALVKGVGADASGPLSFMDVWDAMCRTIMSAGSRRGAMMATMACDHPDIEAFIAAKHDAGRLRMFNLSVLVSDAFMAAVKADKDWELTFEGKVYKTLKARDLWESIMRATFDYAEPGVIFIDRINQRNNLSYCETISATNPCGEQPLPPYGACLLGSINLARLVNQPFETNAGINAGKLDELVKVAVRMMDNVIDLSNFPLEQQKAESLAKRRIGLGVTGLADALIFCGQSYGSEQAAALAQNWMAQIKRSAYQASIELAREKGSFALFDADAYLECGLVRDLEGDIRSKIKKYGIRNALLTSIAPTGTISLLAENVSSGIEPVFSFSYKRSVLLPDGSKREARVLDYAYARFREKFGDEASLPDYFVSAQTLSAKEHLIMQAALQVHVDSSISKTINCPKTIDFDDFKHIYQIAYDLDLKGCTTYRPNDVTGAVLMADEDTGSGHSQDGQASLPLEAPAPPKSARDDGIVYMKQPLERDNVLPGYTYKVRWPESDHAIYITLNDIIQDGRRRPFEIFINSKNMEHYAWTVALTRMISAVFRRGGDVSFVVEELKAVFDPRGGQWMNGKYVPSLLAAIGGVIERHMIDTGFIIASSDHITPASAGQNPSEITQLNEMKFCPKCDMPALVFQEGCHSCLSCGYSKCG